MLGIAQGGAVVVLGEPQMTAAERTAQIDAVLLAAADPTKPRLPALLARLHGEPPVDLPGRDRRERMTARLPDDGRICQRGGGRNGGATGKQEQSTKTKEQPFPAAAIHFHKNPPRKDRSFLYCMNFLMTDCNVSLSGDSRKAWFQTDSASRRRPIIHSTSPRCAEISASLRSAKACLRYLTASW